MRIMLTLLILLLVSVYAVSSVYAVGFLGTVSDPTNFTVAENTTSVGTIAVDPGSVVDANQVTTSVTGTDASNFSIIFDSANDRVVLNFSNHTPDYETKRSYTFNATIDEPGDGGEANSITINVTITDLNEAPVLVLFTVPIPINQIVITSGIRIAVLTVTDPDAVDADGAGTEDDTDINPENTGADAFRYTLTATHANRFEFAEVNEGVEMRTNAPLDPETDYLLNVQVFDGLPDATGVLGSDIISTSFTTGTIAEAENEQGNRIETATILIKNLGVSTRTSTSATPKTPLKRRSVVQRCGLGWSPQSPYTHHLNQPKVMIYALEFEYVQDLRGRYICSVIEIRTGDPTLTHLDGWQLYLGTLYNPSYIPIVITQANSQIRNNVLRLTPEMLGLETFPCNTVGGISYPLPGVHYVLKTGANVLIDTAYSCFVWGQNAYKTVNGINVESPRRISSAALRDMETPRLERYITNPTGVFITYTGIEAFGWDRFVLSDWLLPPSEPSARGAPSAIQRKIATTWVSLKAPD